MGNKIKCVLLPLFLLSLVSGLSPLSDRRCLLRAVPDTALLLSGRIVPSSIASAAAETSIVSRLDAHSLTIPQSQRNSELDGVDNTYYPQFLEGEWAVTQTMTDITTPLGLKFIGGPNGSPSIAEATFAESKQQLGKPVRLRLRYVPTRWGVAEDRLFNTRQRLDAFAGKTVVASVDYANVGGSNRRSVLLLGGKEEDPLQTTVTLFKGPVAQKTFVLSHGTEILPGDGTLSAAVYEVNRSIFALTNQNTAPPVTTDTESVWGFDVVNSDHIRARLRLASYLNAQSDTLYFEARNRAVSFLDYELEMIRVPSTGI